jgi:hypothetical protein
MGTGGEVGNKYYTLNLAPYQAVKIVQFARLADLSVNLSNLDYTTRFTWVSKQELDGVTLNEDLYDPSEGDFSDRDYSIQFLGPNDYITTPLVEYVQNLGEVYVNNTNVNILSLHQVCIRNVNPIGTAPFYSTSKIFDYIDPSWDLVTFKSIYDSTKLDYCFTYNGVGGKYLFSSGNRFLLFKFSQTKNQESSNINHESYVLTIEEPLLSSTIIDMSIIDKIYVNTVVKDDQAEIDYTITPLRYFMSQALFDYDNTSWSFEKYNFYSQGLRRIEIEGVNLSHEGLLINTGILNEADWSISTTVYSHDATLNNVIVEYTGNDANYGRSGSDLFVFSKLYNRLLHSGLSNVNDVTLVKLSLVASLTETAPLQYIHYETSGYLIDVSFAETIEYIGCQKLFNYSPLSGLLKFNGLTGTIPGFSEFSLLNVNLASSSAYSGTVSDWTLVNDDNSVFGVYKDLDIEYKEESAYTISSGVVKYVCKFYKVSNDTTNSKLTSDTIVRIPLASIPNSGVQSGFVYIDLINRIAGAEYWASTGTGYIEYTASQAMFSVESNPSVPAEEILPTIKKFFVQNVNANSLWVHQPTLLSGWTINSVFNETNTANYDIIVEYDTGTNVVFNLSNTLDVFLFTRTARVGEATNITENTDVRIYLNYDNEDEEENYFTQTLSSDNDTEYIDGTPVIEYSKYYGNFRLLNNGVLAYLDSVEFFDVNVDHFTSIYNTSSISGTLTVTSAATTSSQFDTKFSWSSLLQIPSVNGGTQFVRFNRLGSGITMDDTSDSNISDSTVIHYIGKDNAMLDVDIFLSLVSISDVEKYEYYSKRNFIEYYANTGEVRLRRSVIDSICAVEIVGIDIQASDIHFVNPDWTVSSSATSGSGGGGTGAYDLKLTYKHGIYEFPSGTVDDELKLCTFYGLTSNIDTLVTQVRLYIHDTVSSAEIENTIDKTGAECLITDNCLNYYMTTGTVKFEATNLAFVQLYKFVLYGVNVDETCIFTRTFLELGGWTITSTPCFYNPDYVDFHFQYNGMVPYVIAGEVFIFQFFDTVTRAINNASILNSISSGSVKETPVTWYSTDNEVNGISGYFISDKDAANGYVHPDNEYFSENAYIFKHYNNLGLTELIAGESTRIANVTSITFLDVNYTINQVYPDRTDENIGISSTSGAIYQDFKIDFGNPYDVSATGTNRELITVYDFYDSDIVDYFMNNSTIALLEYGSITIPIRTLSGENPEYYKMNGLIYYYTNNGDINFMEKSYGGTTTTQVYKIEMEKVNATIAEVIIEYGSWTVNSRRIGSLFTLTFEHNGNNTTATGDTFVDGDDFTNLSLLLGYYAPVYGSSLIDQTTVVTITFNKNETNNDQIARGKLIRRVKDTSGNDVTFTDRLTYPVPTNLYSTYKDYSLLFLTGDARKTGTNTFISVFGRSVLTGSTGKTKEATFVANSEKLQIIRYTVLKSKTSPYDFVCEESGYTNINITSTKPSLGDIDYHVYPLKDIQPNSTAVYLMNNTLGNGNHSLYEILDSIMVFTISDYNGSKVSLEVRRLLEQCGTNFNKFVLSTGDCYMCIVFVNRKFDTTVDLATFSTINQGSFTVSSREKNTVIYESSSRRKLATSIPYAQMSTYMKYHYESVRGNGNSSVLPNVMMLNAERTLNKYRNNAIVYDVDVLI